MRFETGAIAKMRKRSFRWRLVRLLLSATAVATFGGLGEHRAQAEVPKNIKFVVPLPAGAAADIMARLLAEHINQAHGTTMVVENRPGAGGTVGTESVARGVPDGSTVLVVLNPFIIDPLLRKVNYDPLRSFEPVCYLGSTPSVLVVNATSPYRRLADLLDAARAKPGELTLASSGPATATYLAFKNLERAAKVDISFVPFSGVPLAINALLGDHVASVFGVYPPAAEQIKAGRLRAVAAGSSKRIEGLPSVPTIMEAGYKDTAADLWFWLLVPAKTPKETVAQLAGWFKEGLQDPEIKKKLTDQGIDPVAICGSEFKVMVQRTYDDYKRYVHENNIKIE